MVHDVVAVRREVLRTAEQHVLDEVHEAAVPLLHFVPKTLPAMDQKATSPLPSPGHNDDLRPVVQGVHLRLVGDDSGHDEAPRRGGAWEDGG